MKAYSESYYRKSFSAPTMKEAYLKACKWVSTNVIVKDELARNTTVNYKKEEESQLPTITVTLFAISNEADLRKRHCAICKETHGLFFINENCNCSWCNASAYQRRIDESSTRKKQYCAEKLNTGESV